MIARAMAPRRSPARLLAPLALVAALGAVVLVVAAGSSTGGGSETARGGAAPDHKSARYRRSRFYLVRPGDILSSIAQRTGMSVERIQELNPTVDPQALRAGQRLRLQP